MMIMVGESKKVILKDSTLREGLDTPNVKFTLDEKLKIAKLLDKANVPEIEIVAPSHVLRDLEFVKRLKGERVKIRTSGLIYAHKPGCKREIEEASRWLDRLDILMPVSERRMPSERDEKIRCLITVLDCTLGFQSDMGVGFPHSTQTDVEFLLDIGKESVRNGAKRVTVYDTNGHSDPFEIYKLIKRLREGLSVALCFHGHNDLGLATANSLSAVYAGADALDVTINGLGDRAGNACFEQVVLALYLRGIGTGVVLKDLALLSRTVEAASGIPVSKLAPILGEYVFCHKSPSHLEVPQLFEAFDPVIIGSGRSLTNS
jgi:isopropylmalate/homocitrate/citramalate synthase